MGTHFSVKVVNNELNDGRVATIQSLIENALANVDEKMSTYRSESELSRFNNSQTTAPFLLSAETVEVFQHALDISELTAGAFDVTVGPLVEAWGFGPLGEPSAFPSDQDIARLQDQVGYTQLKVDVAASTVSKSNSMLRADLSALAKGYAVDQVTELLDAEGFDSFLVEVGGEVRTMGHSERGDVWRVGIERPGSGSVEVHRLVALQNLSLATSGDYRNYYELDGQRLSHTIDPRTGRPVSHGLTSVSVVEALCVRADAIATALGVLGPDHGFSLAIEQGWAALLIERGKDGELHERETPAFAALTLE
jgi:thiamine biosynthesis lipoprotein